MSARAIRDDVGVARRTRCGEPLGTGDLDPRPLVTNKLTEQRKRLLIEARRGVDTSHVVDDVWHRQPIEQIGVGNQILGVEVQHDVPAERGDAPDDPPEDVEVRCPAEVGDEVEPGATHAGVVERADLRVGERIVDHRHAGEAPAATADGVEHRRVVGAVTARLDEHRAAEPEALLQLDELLESSVGRRVRTVDGEREPGGGSEDVAVRVAAPAPAA